MIGMALAVGAVCRATQRRTRGFIRGPECRKRGCRDSLESVQRAAARRGDQTAQARLMSYIEQLALRHQPGHGADPTGSWPLGPSRLVLGTDPISARSLGRKYGQNGIV